ncbi:HepT-like ribonuclease domain-containing protein [Candidatus Magnetominusculus xianensis]|uniref:DUF86 domain-containing protein n=1 Tax=Candidatus Magnetominusculus xianensis TaxID=1748249 RepID=A0ABR5SEN5_9BACT|nr:DUF86 domain-containing protein [Candidatus Magnetominusculus xianensis]KWT84950.1 hypothetical protein ASN18_1880 [Candidatus Magnetominusculus xianensis]MBF0404468.1 DUF86 domain-containing protein [Nitrospirota bacterium]
MRNVALYLKDILESIEFIEQFTFGMGLEEFRKDVKTSDAVIKRFENIGEAAKKIPDEIKSLHPEIPWKEMAGMRDKLVHVYFGVKHELVWVAVKNRLPLIKPLLNKIFDELPNDH